MPSDDYWKGYHHGRNEYQPPPLSESLKALGEPMPAGCFVVLIALTLIACLVVGAWAYAQMQAQQPVSEGSPTTSSIKPVFHPSGLGTSVWKDGGYSATVTSAAGSGVSLRLGFDAKGASGLFRPEGSCVWVANPVKATERLQVTPALANITTDTDGHYAGTLIYPLLIPGHYTFQYACNDGYSEVEIGTAANIPIVGISESSTLFFAVIFAVIHAGTDVSVLFGTTGGPTANGVHGALEAPDTSCIVSSGSTVKPSVKVDWRVQNGLQSNLGAVVVGAMTFSKANSGSFIYSCGNDYSAVLLPKRS
jgi:hypothetical protein